MDASAIRTLAEHAHTTANRDNGARRELARRAQRGELVRIAPGYYLDSEAITTHPAPPPRGSGTYRFCASIRCT